MQKSVEVLSNKAKNAGSQGPIYSDQIEFIIDDVLKNVETLSLLDDQYGNYVIQHVLQFGRNSDRDSVLEIVVDNGLLAMSWQKFASNVVEKLLKYGSARQRNAIVREMLKVRLPSTWHFFIYI